MIIEKYFLITTEASFVLDDDSAVCNKLIEIERNDAGKYIRFLFKLTADSDFPKDYCIDKLNHKNFIQNTGLKYYPEMGPDEDL